uniref:Uncharacterized protein n=1 Tax=Aegilops tauschii subsp. strangulata TaxID=200361 RepID=A0A453JXY1_AEGTS
SISHSTHHLLTSLSIAALDVSLAWRFSSRTKLARSYVLLGFGQSPLVAPPSHDP